jgi:hypothetical protein
VFIVCDLEGPDYAGVVLPERENAQDIAIVINLVCRSIIGRGYSVQLQRAGYGFLSVAPPICVDP